MVPGETDYLHLIRDFITAVSRKVGFTEARVGEIEIAIDEACANIIEHAYGAAACAEEELAAIMLRVLTASDRLEVRILDRGPAFSAEKERGLNVAEFLASDRRRGIGSYIIHTFMDEVRHTYHPGEGNELTLVKYLPAAGTD